MLDRRGDPAWWSRPFYLGRAATSTPCLRKTSVLQLEHKKVDRAVRFLLCSHAHTDIFRHHVPPWIVRSQDTSRNFDLPLDPV